MTEVQLIESKVKRLDRTGLSSFRKWFHGFDLKAWERQIENDVRFGKLDKFGEEALAAHRTGKTTEM